MSTSIFTFDHGQKKLNKAVGVTSEYLDDLQDTVKKILLKAHEGMNNDDNADDDDDGAGCSPSELVEAALNEFSYSQLVLLSSFYLRDKMEDIHKRSMIKMMSSEDGQMPQELKDILDKIKNAIENRESEDEE
jgi:hypothetical protein